MPKGGPLLTLLRRIQRRLRLFAALEGAVAGGAIAALVLAGSIAIGRLGVGRHLRAGLALPLGFGFAGLLAGALIRGLREIPLERCARLADAALDRQDRVLSAFHLERVAAPPLVAALVADAVKRAARLAPATAVPARRPRGLATLGATALALGLALLFPVRSRAARELPAPTTPSAGLAAGALDVEHEAARAALAEAARLEDGRLAALATVFAQAVRDLTSGKLTDGDALDALQALDVRVAEAARDADRDRRAAEAATRALDEHPETRAAGQALSSDDAGSAERARDALGASAEAQPSATARSLAAAAQGLAASSDAAGDGRAETGPRRLSRDAPSGDASRARTGQDDPGQRRLEQLRRDLDQTSAACRDGDPGCRAGAQRRADDLSRLARQGAAAEGLRRLERATSQLRERIGHGELRDGDPSAARRFARAAEGKTPSGRAGPPGERESRGNGSDGSGTRAQAGGAPAGSAPAGEEKSGAAASGTATEENSGHGGGSRAGDGADESGASAAEAEGNGAQAGEGAATSPGKGTGAATGEGSGIGKQAGGPPLGARDDAGPSRGRESQAHLATGEGPNRAQVIGAAAGRGFVAGGYARVYSDYAAAVEDALGATAVPEGKRFIVRRYFDLIRPRSQR